jgi:putative membrane protein insertion efficiency factor
VHLLRLAPIGLIRLYQILISPLLPPACRFYPSCSHYAADAIANYGVLRGGWLALTRLARCHPWHPGGVDFVPAPATCRNPER